MIKKQLLLLSVLCFIGLSVFAQTATSIQDGPWNDINTWDTGVVPTSSNTTSIVINNSVNVPNSFSVTVDQVSVSISATLTIDAGGTVTVADDGTAANDLDVYNDGIDYGFLTVSGTLICNNSAKIIGADQGNANFNSGSIYRHLYTTTEGSIPVANWNSSSTVQIQGYTASITASASGNWSQDFGNFTFNCSSLGSGIIQFQGLLTSVTNDLTISSTGGTGSARFSTTQNPTIVIGRDLIISGTSRVVFNTTGGSTTINIGRDFVFNSTNGTGTNTNSTGSTTFNIDRDFSMNASGGQLILSSGAGAGNGTFNIIGNFTLTAGTITETSSSTGVGNLNFITSAVHTFSNSGTITNTINFSVESLSTLDLGTSVVSGGGSFTLNGTLRLGSTDSNGALQNNTTAGNIRTPTGTRTFASNSTIVYNGTAAQFIGNGFPSSGVVNLTINNSNGVTLSTNLAIVALSQLTLTSGNIVIGTQTLTINGTVSGSGGIVGGSTSNLTIGGTGSFGTLTFSGSNQLQNFTLNRTSSGTVTLGGNLTILGTFTHTAGTLVIGSNTFTISGVYDPASPGNLSVTSSSSIIIDGTGTLPSDIGFTGTALGTLTLDRASTTLTTTSSITINNLNLTSGTFSNGTGITIGTGGTITREGGSMSTSPNNTTNAYNVVYTSGTVTSGPELPSNATALSNLSKTGTGTLTLGSNITINGILTLSSGSFVAGTSTIDLKGNFVSNAGSTLTSSDFTFSGTTTISGTSAPTFGVVTVSGSLTPSVNVRYDGTLTVGSAGVLNAGTATTTFGGTTPITVNAGGSIAFNSIIINSSSSMTAPSVALSIGGSITNNGTFTGSSSSVTVTGSITNNGSGTFTAPSGTLNLAGNFTNSGTFTHNSGTVNFNGTTTITGTPTFNNITIAGTLNGPASLTLAGNFTNSGTFSAGSGNLNLAGNFTNNGTFTASTGTLVINGGTAQSISGSSVTNFNNITISKSSGTATVSTNQNLTNTLTLTAGTLNANGRLTLISTSSGDARIAEITGGASITGNIIAQRYLPNTNVVKAYRYLSTPVSGTFVSDWKAEFPITGTFNDPSTQAEWPAIPGIVQASPSMYIYNEAHTPTSTMEDRFETYPVNGTSSTASAITTGRGYAAFVRQTAPITLNLTGAPNQGAVGVNVTAQSGGGNDGWNLIGNPYAAPINWDNVTRPAGVNAQIAFKDNTNNMGLGAGQYVYFTQGSPGTGIPASFTGTIPSGQAFWVRATANATITFQENDKQAISNPTFIRQGSLEDIVRVSIAGNSRKDEIVIRFADDATDIADNSHDAFKLKNDFINLSSLSSDDLKMAINTMGGLNCNKDVRLVVNGVTPGSYAFTFTQFESFSEEVSLILLDNFTGATFDITKEDPTYEFSVTADVNTFGENRFKMFFKYPAVKSDLTLNSIDVCLGNDAIVTVQNSQKGVKYYSTINGNAVSDQVVSNGGDLLLNIPTGNLASGDNAIVVMASIAGCSAIPLNQSLSIKAVNIPLITSVQNAKNCREGQLTLKAEGAPSNGSYKWYETADATAAIEGQTGAEFITPTLNKTKTYFVSAINSLGCEGERMEVVAEIINYDDALIIIDGQNLVSSYESGNQWYLNGEPIAGATTQSLEVKQSGLYEVEVTINGCTTRASQEMIVTGIETSSYGKGVKLYPNPVTNYLTVELPLNLPADGNVQTALGQPVGPIKFTSSGDKMKGEFHFENQAPGLYLINIQQGKSILNYKIIKK